MGLLKKIYKVKAASLVETIVATIIVTIIFTIATVSVTRVLKQSVNSSTHQIDTELQKLSYLQAHGKLKVPDTFEKDGWSITSKKVIENNVPLIIFTAENKETKKIRVKKIIE